MMLFCKTKGNRKEVTGQSLVEMVCAIALIVPLLLLLIDGYFILLGYWLCTSNCRLAARAAAQGPPSAIERGAPQQRALASLHTSFAQAGKMIQLASINVSESIKSLPDRVGGGPVNGTVSVDVTLDVAPPFLLKIFSPEHKFTIHASNTCPYTWTTPAIISPTLPPENR